MDKRRIVLDTLEFRSVPYVPWAWGTTELCARRLEAHLGVDDLGDFLDSHFLDIGPDIGRFERIGKHLFRDAYGVVWDKSVDKDIGATTGRTPPATSCTRTYPSGLQPTARYSAATCWGSRCTSEPGPCEA